MHATRMSRLSPPSSVLTLLLLSLSFTFRTPPPVPRSSLLSFAIRLDKLASLVSFGAVVVHAVAYCPTFSQLPSRTFYSLRSMTKQTIDKHMSEYRVWTTDILRALPSQHTTPDTTKHSILTALTPLVSVVQR